MKVFADTQIDKVFGKADKEAARLFNSMITGVRRFAQVSISMSQAFGGLIDQTYALGIEAGLLSLELVSSIFAAESAATFGLSGFFKAGAQAAAIISMIVAISNINSGRADAARRTQGAVAAFRLMSF